MPERDNRALAIREAVDAYRRVENREETEQVFIGDVCARFDTSAIAAEPGRVEAYLAVMAPGLKPLSRLDERERSHWGLEADVPVQLGEVAGRRETLGWSGHALLRREWYSVTCWRDAT